MIQTTLATVSPCFAAELPELTLAIQRGEDVTHRVKVLREYAKTWGAIAEPVFPSVREESTL